MRDHRKLVAFHAADAFALAVYEIVPHFPAHERFGLALQLRRAAVSVAANIVEGCARETASDFAHFLTMAYASSREAQYEIDLAIRLGYIKAERAEKLTGSAARSAKLLNKLVARVRLFRSEDTRPR